MVLYRKISCTVQLVNKSSKRLLSTSGTAQQSLRKWYRDFWTPKRINLPPYEHFTQIGDPVLRSRAAEVPVEHVNSKEIDLVVEKMIRVMRKFDCVGVSAPQIGVSLRIIALQFPEHLKEHYSKALYETRKMSTLPLTVILNPTLKISSYEKSIHPEGCMSVKGYTADVERYNNVIVSGLDTAGDTLQLELNGWNARIAQHEVDHLNGKLYTDHMDPATFACTGWEVINKKCGRVEISFYK